jgi:ribosome-binding protein aMBF1 (putative translation factor)
MIRGDLIRAGRALLGWSSKTLAARAHVGTATVLRIERGHPGARGQCQSLEKIEAALREAGIHFMDDDGHGPGLRLQGQTTMPNAH